jgi:pimeloyl-ACP methyl ester carboxylesterase
LEPALPSVLFNSPEFGAGAATAGSLYESGNKAGAIDGFGQEVGGADYRTHFDQTLPSGHFERWVADADTLFQSDVPALQSWMFSPEDAIRITQPVINMSGADSKTYFREIYATIQKWLPHAENFIVPDSTHCMLQMNPKAVAERLASFFSKHALQA